MSNMAMEDTLENKHGRPTRKEQNEIQEILRVYFNRNMSASATSVKTGINIKTVCKYFDQWVKELQNSVNQELLLRRQEERERMILSFDIQIQEGYDFRDKIEKQIEKLEHDGKDIPHYLLSLKLDTMKYTTFLSQRRNAAILQFVFEWSYPF